MTSLIKFPREFRRESPIKFSMKLPSKFNVMGLPIVAFLFIANFSWAQVALSPDVSQKIGTSLSRISPDPTGAYPILIIMKAQADLDGAERLKTKKEKGKFVYEELRTLALKTQSGLADFLRGHNVNFQRFYIMNMVAVESAPPDLIKEIAARPDVAKIIANPAIRNHFLPPPFHTDSFQPGEAADNIVSTGAPKVWSELGITGKGIVVAGQDTGVQWDHPALLKHYRGYSPKGIDHTLNWHDAIHVPIVSTVNPCGYDLKVPCDDDQHGTHTMGTMVGDDGGENKIGMAPGAQWMACRNMDQGTGRPTTYIECFEFLLAPYPQGGNSMTEGNPSAAPDIVNNSWGCPESEGCESDEFVPVLKAMERAGILIVASAGNDGPKCGSIKDPPADNSDLTLTVGAYDFRNGKIAPFSSRGPSAFDGGMGPDVAAPGVNIRSSIPGNDYASDWSGTSMAAPHVAGEAALLWSADPTLIGDIRQTVKVIETTATPMQASDETCGGLSGAHNPSNTWGYGVINAYKAVLSRLHRPVTSPP